jgi:ATP synthase protein I
MQQHVSDGGDLSQDAQPQSAHPKAVSGALKREVPDRVAQSGRSAYAMLADSAVGLEFGISVIIGLAFGRWLDGEAGTDPWFMFVFLMIGLAAGFRSIMRAVRRADLAAGQAGGAARG